MLLSKDIFKRMAETKRVIFDKAWVQNTFTISEHNAVVRLERLRKWGVLKRYRNNPDNWRSGFSYEITDWGRKYYKYTKGRKN